jgi:hypothetical protein
MRVRIGVVVALGRDAERLHRRILVGGAHRLVAGLVGAIHRLANGADRVRRTIHRRDEIELCVNGRVEQRTAALGLPLDNLARQNAGQHAELMLGKDRSERVVNVVDAPELVALLRVLVVLAMPSVAISFITAAMA